MKIETIKKLVKEKKVLIVEPETLCCTYKLSSRYQQ
jgi:hypothetical protein